MKMLMWDQTDKKYREVIDVKEIEKLRDKIHEELDCNDLFRFFQGQIDSYFNKLLEEEICI